MKKKSQMLWFSFAPAGPWLEPSPCHSDPPIVPLDRWKARGQEQWLWNEPVWDVMLPGFPGSLVGGQGDGDPN